MGILKNMIAFAFSTTACAPPAFADVGERAITVSCDRKKGHVEAWFYVLWNEQLEVYNAKYPSGESTDGSSNTRLFEVAGGPYQNVCEVKGRKVTFRLEDGSLTLYENGRLVTNKQLDTRWFTADFEYRLRSDKANDWEECINAEYGSFSGKLACGPLTSSPTIEPRIATGGEK